MKITLLKTFEWRFGSFQLQAWMNIRFNDYNMRGFTDKEAHYIILGEAAWGQDDVSALSMDEDYETGTEVIDLTGEED